ncbi:MAG TPA: hypothetical protein PLS50_01005, partial [Candidatus Dojkabacteria bacterium]|nr:hypothetical protein [Candidatus Dojkabacteria bacterium]
MVDRVLLAHCKATFSVRISGSFEMENPIFRRAIAMYNDVYAHDDWIRNAVEKVIFDTPLYGNLEHFIRLNIFSWYTEYITLYEVSHLCNASPHVSLNILDRRIISPTQQTTSSTSQPTQQPTPSNTINSTTNHITNHNIIYTTTYSTTYTISITNNTTTYTITYTTITCTTSYSTNHNINTTNCTAT